MHKVVFIFGEFKSRKCSISLSRDYARKGQKNKKALKNQGFSWLYLFYSPYLVAGRGFEPPDLRVMSPTSYQAALPRDIRFVGITPLYHKCGAGDRSRTGTILSYHGILSPGRLPIPPHRHSWTTVMDSRIGSQKLLYHNYYPLSTPFIKFFKYFLKFLFCALNTF